MATFLQKRNFKSDNYSDYWTCILLDSLERFLRQINLHRSWINRIFFNFSFLR